MKPLKKQMIDTINALPDDITVEEMMERLYVKAQILEGMEELREGKGIPHEEVEKRAKKWLEK